MAYNLGLNVDPRTWDIPSLEQKRRKRLWWAVYVYDKWFLLLGLMHGLNLTPILPRSATALGRPSLVDDSQMDVEPLLESDFMEGNCDGVETDVPLQYRTSVSMASLSIILSDLLKTFYTIKSKQEWLKHRSAEKLFSEYARLDRSLTSWEEESLIPLLQVRAYPDPIGSIILAYHTLRVILYRAVLLKLERLETDASLIIDKAFAVSSDAISFVQNLTMSQMSAFWWPCESYPFQDEIASLWGKILPPISYSLLIL
ncbi:uncharacterized protein FPRN_14603 [Fusarium proliferatum]|nr:uncharacterized protein FPRN_14603 [Fusarium proliferatum]